MPTRLRLAEQDSIVPEHFCPHCGHKFDRASAINPDGEPCTPKPGNYTICIECAGWLVFKADLSTRKLDALDILSMPNDCHLILITASHAIKAVHSKLRPTP